MHETRNPHVEPIILFLDIRLAVFTYIYVHLQSNKCPQFDNVGLVGNVKL